MHEIFPVVVGAALGLTFSRQAKTLKTILLLAFVAICAAVVASAVSGELALSWWYVGVDLSQIVVAAALTTAVAFALGRAGLPGLQ
jgi:hypothetical protein